MEKIIEPLPEIKALYPTAEELKAIATGKAIYPDTLLFRHDLTSETAMQIIKAVSEGQTALHGCKSGNIAADTANISVKTADKEVQKPVAAATKAQENIAALRGFIFLIIALVALFAIGAFLNYLGLMGGQHGTRWHP